MIPRKRLPKSTTIVAMTFLVSFQLPVASGFYVQNTRTSKFRSASARSVASFFPSDETPTHEKELPSASSIEEVLAQDLSSVVTASLLVTGNTFGAGCLVMPQLLSEVGSSTFQGLFIGAYLLNLLSGMAIMEIAVHQKEQQDNAEEVPSSFQEFAQHALESPTAASMISALSMLVNMCVLTFDLSRIGAQVSEYTHLPAPMVSAGWAGLVALGLGKLSHQRLGQMAFMFCMSLFASFAALLLPSLSAQAPDITSAAPPIDPSAVSQVAPVILMAMVFQNIVPSITRLLDYDRVKVTASMAIGTGLPLLMYTSFAAAGGDSGSLNPLILAIFSLSCLCGSAIGTGMSLTEEMQHFVAHEEVDASCTDDAYRPQAVAVSLTLPLAATIGLHVHGGDMTGALGLAGSFGSPILYGVVPAIIALKQQRSGVALPLGALASIFVGQELVQSLM